MSRILVAGIGAQKQNEADLQAFMLSKVCSSAADPKFHYKL